MDQISDLRELLKHELKDLYSAETQIIEGLPKMIEKAKSPQLKKALTDHLKVTHDQKKRLDEIEDILNYKNNKEEENGGFFANLFKSKEGEEHCKAMEGLIKEGESVIKEDMTPEVMDAAIIMACQKIEHYEISSYGTAKAYANQLGLGEVEAKLKQTLAEEYFADDSLTKLAVTKINLVAEVADNSENGMPRNNAGGGRTKSAAKKSPAKKSVVKKSAPAKSVASAPKKAAAKKAAPQKAVAKKAAPKKSAPKKTGTKKAAPKKAVVKKAAPKKSASKKAAPKKAMNKKAAPKKTAIKKASPKKSASKKSAPKKAMNKKAAPKKGMVKKSVSKKGATKKSATKKTISKKAGARTAPAKKSTANKGSRRR